MILPPLTWIGCDDWATGEQQERLAQIWSEAVLTRVREALEREGSPCFLVGGSVRDLLLTRESKDLDLVVECSGKRLLAMKNRLAETVSATPVVLDSDRGILRLAFKHRQEVDLVALQGDDLRSDLARRDFTVNAMAVSAEGELADPFGGLRDLRERRLCRVRAGNFFDDPLRAVRLLRFAAQLNFEVDSKTFEEANAAHRVLERAAGERVAEELRKFFCCAGPPALELLRSSRLDSALGVRMGEAAWDLLATLSRRSPVGWPLGLALWLGECSASEAVGERLKLSRRDVRWLSAWHQACGFVMLPRCWDLGEIFELSLVAGPCFEEFARVLQSETFPTSMGRDERAQVLLESKKQGSINWESPPWNGDLVAARLEREPGPWIKRTLDRLAKVWASGRARDLEEALSLLSGD